MVRFGLVLNRTSMVLVCIVPFMLTAIPFSLYYRTDDIPAILLAAGATLIASLAMYFLTSKEGEANHKEGILITTLGWILAAGFGALPFYFYGTFPTYTDCYFEAMSGFTTTGASVLAEIEKQPAGILFWRSLTHWIGGMGIVVLSLAILPALGAGGMQLFKAEVPGPTADKLVPRLRDTAKRLYVVYTIISAAEVVFLLAGGMSLFDSLTHMFGTMGTGGFSPKNASVGSLPERLRRSGHRCLHVYRGGELPASLQRHGPAGFQGVPHGRGIPVLLRHRGLFHADGLPEPPDPEHLPNPSPRVAPLPVFRGVHHHHHGVCYRGFREMADLWPLCPSVLDVRGRLRGLNRWSVQVRPGVDALERSPRTRCSGSYTRKPCARFATTAVSCRPRYSLAPSPCSFSTWRSSSCLRFPWPGWGTTP